MSTILGNFNTISTGYQNAREFLPSDKKTEGVDSLISYYSNTKVTSSQDLLTRTSKFTKGLLKSSNLQVPVELIQKKSNITFKYQDKESGLVISIKFEVTPLSPRGKISFESLEPTLKARILSTRFFYLFFTAESHFLVMPDGSKVDFILDKISEAQKQKLLYKAKVLRKLLFIEKCLETQIGHFQVPLNISSDDVWLIDNIFRGITRGRVYSKTRSITTYKAPPFDLDLAILLDKRPTPTFFEVNGVSLFGQNLPLGNITVIMPYAVLLNSDSIINKIKSGYNKEIELTFNLIDERVIFHFKDFMHKLPEQNRLLNHFKEELLSQEPPVLANLLVESLSKSISSEESTEIVVAWLYTHLSNVLWPLKINLNKTELDVENKRWYIAVVLFYDLPKIQMHGALSAIFVVDSETGIILKHPTVNELETEIRLLLEKTPNQQELLKLTKNSYESVNSEILRNFKIANAARKALTNKEEADKHLNPSSILEESPPEEISNYPKTSSIDFSKIRKIRRKA